MIYFATACRSSPASVSTMKSVNRLCVAPSISASANKLSWYDHSSYTDSRDCWATGFKAGCVGESSLSEAILSVRLLAIPPILSAISFIYCCCWVGFCNRRITRSAASVNLDRPGTVVISSRCSYWAINQSITGCELSIALVQSAWSFLISSSGSLAPSDSEMIVSSIPVCSAIGMARSVAASPALSPSNANLTFSLRRFKARRWYSVIAVPAVATTPFIPTWWLLITSRLPSTITE